MGQSLEDRLINSFVNRHELYMEDQHFLLDYIPLIKSSISILNQRSLCCQLTTKALFFEFLELTTYDKILIEYSRNEIPKNIFSYIERASNYIIKNITNKLTVHGIAEAVYTSERNLRYLFRQHLNTTVVGFINKQKMEYASHLLEEMIPVQEVCETMNIGDTSQFSRMFKKYQLQSPKQFQMEYLQNRCVKE